MCFKIFLIQSFVGHLVRQSRTVCAIFAKGNMRKISWKFLLFGPVVQKEIKDN